MWLHWVLLTVANNEQVYWLVYDPTGEGVGVASQEVLNIDVEGRAGHGELEATNYVWVKDP